MIDNITNIQKDINNYLEAQNISKFSDQIEILDAKDVANILHVNKNTVAKLFARQDFPALCNLRSK